MTMLYGYRLDDRGKMQIALYDADEFPQDWFDAPDKAERAANPVEKRPTLTLDPRFAKPKRAK